jgi:protein gp37
MEDDMNNVKKSIGWADYTINPIKGLCPMGCSYCYARAMYKRFKWNPEIRYEHDAFTDIGKLKNPSRIFVGSTMELFGGWVDYSTMWHTFNVVRQFPQHTFIFLTKLPENLAKWSPFPDNCYIGASVTNAQQLSNAYCGLGSIKATVKFLSYEPLLTNVVMQEQFLKDAGINWVIIGQQTPISAKTSPKIEWIKEIVDAADKAVIPVFLKDNLFALLDIESSETDFAFNSKGELRQEFSKVML